MPPQSCDVRIVYPLFWSRLGRQASWEQAANTIAALARRRHEITVLIPRDLANPALTAEDLRTWFDVEGNFEVVQRPSRWAGERLHRTLLWLRQVFGDPETRGADILYSRIPAMFAMGGLSPVPFTTDHYRPWPDVYPAIRPLVRRTARHPKCLGVVLHSRHAAGAFVRAGVPDDRILVAHNGYDPRGGRLDTTTAREQLALPTDRPIALYAGRIGPTKGLDTLLALADRRPDVLFVLVGAEGESEIARAAARRPNVSVVRWAQPADLPAWLAAADILLIPPSRAPLERFGTCILPMKLFAYLAAGKPILAPVSPDTAELLEQGTNAWLVPADDPQAAVEGLDRLLADAALSQRLAANALRLSEGLTWDARAEKIERFLLERLAGVVR